MEYFTMIISAVAVIVAVATLLFSILTRYNEQKRVNTADLYFALPAIDEFSAKLIEIKTSLSGENVSETIVEFQAPLVFVSIFMARYERLNNDEYKKNKDSLMLIQEKMDYAQKYLGPIYNIARDITFEALSLNPTVDNYVQKKATLNEITLDLIEITHDCKSRHVSKVVASAHFRRVEKKFRKHRGEPKPREMAASLSAEMMLGKR